MPQNHQKYYSKLLVSFILLFIAGCSCSFSGYDFSSANQHEEMGEHHKALRLYDKIINKDPESKIALESLRRAARISDLEIQDFQRAISYYKKILLLSPKADERVSTQKTIADIYFEKLNDYSSSISEYNKFLTLKIPNASRVETLLKIAKAHYYKSEFFQAESEAEQAFNLASSEEQSFEIKLFLANIFYNTKRVDKAIESYKELIEDYPKLAQKENVEMSIVVALEESQKFAEAIELLEKMKSYYSEPDFLDLKIKSLKQRQANMPGFKGLRK